MRSDYGLYGIAIICFVIAGVFMAGAVPDYTLMEQAGIAVSIVFLLLGVIFAAAGYTTRPKAAMPTTQPTLTPVMAPKETLTQPTVEETPPPPPPSSPPPQEEVQPEPQPPAQPEPSPPTTPVSMETEQPVVAEEEKPRPARRRRKKATA